MHLALVGVALPFVIFALVRLNFVQLALSVIVLSKWRMFAVKPRFWAANVRSGAVDLIVGVAVVLFMTHSGGLANQLLWAVLYAVWLIAIKPATGTAMITGQAFIGQLAGLMALYLTWAGGPLYGLTALTGLICYLAARHFFDSFDEPYSRLLSYVWGYFGTALAWVLGHLLISYPRDNSSGLLSQPVLFLTIIGYGLAILYYADHFDRSSRLLRRQTTVSLLLLVIILIGSLYWRSRHLVV